MDVRITSRHETKTSKSSQDRITDEINKLAKYYDKVTSCHVILDNQHGMDIVEIVLHAHGQVLTATTSDSVMSKAIDDVIAKIERQLKKINEKVKSHKGPGLDESSVGVN